MEEKLRIRPEEPQFLSQMSLALAYLGEKDEAIALGKRAIEFLPVAREAFDGPFLLINMAEVLVAIGEYGAAIDQLSTVLSIPGFVSVDYLRLDPLWRPLRNEKKFKSLLAGKGKDT